MTTVRYSPLADNEVFLYRRDWTNRVAMSLLVRLWFYAQDRFSDETIHLIPMHLFTMEDTAVSRKPKEKSKVEGNADFIGFVNITLTDDEMGQVDAYLEAKDPPELGANLEALLDVGKVSLNYQRGTLNVSCVVQEGEMAGYAVSAYGSSPLETTTILWFKVDRYLKDFKTIYEKGGNTRKRG